MKLVKKTILITGGSAGIGLALAKQLVERGNTVVVTGRDQSKLDEATRSISGLQAIKSDVSDPAAIVALHAEMLQAHPTLDVVINNAGIMRNLDLNKTRNLADVTREIEINLMGPVRMVQQFTPHLKTRPDALIVIVSSGLAFVPLPISPVYSATKAALHSFSQSLRVQLDGSSVKVIELAPPGVETQLFRGEFEKELKGRKAMDPAELVRRAIAGIEAGKQEIRPGESNMLKIMSRLAPQLALSVMAKVSKPR